MRDREAGAQTSLERIVADSVGNKAASTVLLRARAFARYQKWLEPHEFSSVAVREVHAYQYAQQSTARPTSVSSFLSSLAFAGHMFGLQGAMEAAGSSRIRGISDRMLSKRAPVDQSAPLTVEQVKLLEAELEYGKNVEQKVLVGHCLAFLWLRARWSDGQFIWQVSLDAVGIGGYIEATAEKTKTSKKARARGHELPLSGPAGGLGGNSWFDRWLAARKEAGLPEKRTKGQPFMPAVDAGGMFIDRPLSSGEASEWLCRLVGAKGAHGGPIKSHSLKTTLLSWAAKAGLSHDSRRILGYHVAPGDKSLVTYSRDAIAGPLRELCRVVGQIRDGAFFPDQSRSGYLAEVPGGSAAAGSQPREVEATPVPSPSTPSSSSSLTACPLSHFGGIKVLEDAARMPPRCFSKIRSPISALFAIQK